MDLSTLFQFGSSSIYSMKLQKYVKLQKCVKYRIKPSPISVFCVWGGVGAGDEEMEGKGMGSAETVNKPGGCVVCACVGGGAVPVSWSIRLFFCEV